MFRFNTDLSLIVNVPNIFSEGTSDAGEILGEDILTVLFLNSEKNCYLPAQIEF